MLLQNEKVQTGITRYIATEISKIIGAEISVANVSVTFLNRLQLKDIYIQDLNGDTLLYAKKVKVNLRQLNRIDKSLSIGKLAIDEADIHFISDSSGILNLKFITEYLKGNRKKQRNDAWKLSFDNIELNDSRFRYSKDEEHIHDSGIDFKAMDIEKLNLRIGNFDIRGDTIDFLVRKLVFEEKSGFILANFRAKMSLSKKHMTFDNILFSTPFSEVSANTVEFNFSDFNDFSDYVNKVENQFNIRSSKVDFRDIGYFATAFRDYSQYFQISGLITGTIADMHADNILISYNKNTVLETSFYMIGLPDFRETFMHFNITRFQTSMEDLRSLNLPNGKSIPLPDPLNEFKIIRYSGEYTGYFDDFVAFGKFKTSLGQVSSDIRIKPNARKGFSFQGSLKTESFNIGDLLNEEQLAGNISMSLNVDGYNASDSLFAELTGKIDSVELNSYLYKNINLSGTLINKTFDGALKISDPNIQMNFLGKVDFSEALPEFKFTADVRHLRPYYLNLIKSDPSYFTSFLLRTNFKGNNMDNLTGEINLVNSYFEKSDENLQIYNFNLKANSGQDSAYIKVESDIMDAELKGSYHFSSLKTSFINLVDRYVPSLINDSLSNSVAGIPETNKFDFNIELKNISRTMHFFLPEYNIANNSSFTGSFRPADNQFLFRGESERLTIFENTWEDLLIDSKSDLEVTEINTSSKRLTIKDKFTLENISLNTRAYNDTVLMKMDWHSDESPKYNGNLRFLADLGQNVLTGNSNIELSVLPSSLVFNDKVWHIPESKILIDSNAIQINSFSTQNEDQLFQVSGSVSKNPGDSLSIRLRNFDLSGLDALSRESKLKFEGSITGEINLMDLYNNPLILSNLRLKEVSLNNERLGDGKLEAFWNNSGKKINIVAGFKQETSDILSVRGDYFPKEGKLDFAIEFDKIKLNTFHPFLEKYVSDIKGLGSGKLSLGGNLKKPDFNGQIQLFKASLKIDYLQTRYHLSNVATVKNNNFLFDEFDLFDELGNRAKVQGRISTRYLRDMTFNFRIQTNKFMFLNTNEHDNELFYGRVFAGGLVNITGPLDNIRMSINARTEANSIFYLPLYTVGEVNQSDFITFSNGKTDEKSGETIASGYEVKMKGLSMDFNLEITPDAEVQLIFDPVIGDILKGRGNGNLNIGVNTLGKFEIFGDIIIENGDYLFTLQNVINKKFEVKPGGRISWTGDPADANIDLEAYYPLRTSVYNLALGFNYDESSSELESLKKRIPVECQIRMTGKLLEPTIKPDIELPTADQQTRNIVENSISTEEDLMVQFLSLLVINNFISTQNLNNSGGGGRNTAYEAGLATTSELLSNQFNRLVSQISKEVDIGVNYRVGNEITTDELEVALSTQILNDRVTINGNVDVGGSQQTPTYVQNTNNIVGDFDVDVKITQNGKFHVKAFNRSNDNLLVYTSPYTQGVGVMYKEDFNSIGDLFKRYRDAILRLFTSEEKKKKETVQENPELSE